MFRKKIKNIFLIFILSLILFWISSQAKAQEEPLFDFSLNFQKLIKNFQQKLFPSTEEDFYKEKYYQLLQELAKLKLTLKQVKETEIIAQREKYLPNLVSADILKVDSFGYIYAENPKVKEGTLVLDKNWALVGKVTKITKNYLIVTSLNVPGIEFNTANLDGELLGLGKTISNGFLEINYVKPEIQVKLNDFILTYGDDNFPSGFLVGTVKKINKTQFGQQIIVKLLFELDSGKIYLFK
jgi:cell shape-determining protein MreC